MELKRFLQDGRGLYYTTTSQLRDYILTYFAKESINLGNVDNTSDINKPVSSAMTAALNNKVSKTDPYVQSINNTTGNVTIDKSFIGLGNVDNTSDLNKPVSTLTKAQLDTKVALSVFNSFSATTTTSLNSKVSTSLIGSASGITPLDNNRKVPLTYIPALTRTIVSSSVVADGFTVPVNLHLSGDINGVATISGRDSDVFIDTSLQINTSIVEGVYGSLLESPIITVDKKGRVVDITSAPIARSSVSAQGLVQLNDTVTSTSVTEAATARVVKQVYDFAYNVSTNYLKISSKGVPSGVATLDASGLIPISQIPPLSNLVADRLSTARDISLFGDGTWSTTFNGSANTTNLFTLKDTLVNDAGTFGSPSTTLKLDLDKKGRTISVEAQPIAIPFSSVTNKPSTASTYGITDVYTKTDIDNLIANLNFIPVGTVITAYRDDNLIGWLKMDGTLHDRNTYPELSAVLDMNPHVLSNDTHFYLEDIGGLFPRYLDSKGSRDPSRALGSVQLDMFKEHDHLVKEGSINPLMSGISQILTSGDDFTRVASYQSNTTIVGGEETRPKNIALCGYIKV